MISVVLLLSLGCCFVAFRLLRLLVNYVVHFYSTRSNAEFNDEKQEACFTEKNPYHDIEPLPDFDWSTTPPIRNLPLKSKYHLTMALENISLSDIIAMDNTYAKRMQIRRSIMDEHTDATLQCNPVCGSAVLELHDWIFRTYLPTRFPGIYKPVPSGLLNTASNEHISLHQMSPMSALRSLGDHIDTDFLLLLPSSTAPDGSPIYHLEAFVTCFPSGFSTKSKLGLPLAEIHTPVPGYKAKLERSMDRFFARIECGRAVKRSNWALTTHDLLFTEGGNHMYADGTTDQSHSHEPEAEPKNEQTPESQDASIARQRKEVVIANCRLRSERQTLFRLPRTKALVFSFKTYQYTLGEVRRDGYAEQLAEAMEGLSKGNVPEMDFYKRGVVWREPVVEFLRS